MAVVNIPSSARTAGTPESPEAGEPKSPSGEPSDTGIGSVEDLQEKMPELWEKMMEAMAMDICKKSKEHVAKLKKLSREGR